ncbi:MAG: desulfoferrodoxin [Candidatus Pacebacteria bacterium]|nr:desulfoferrodoxin [Candidatus Paceibacterota bacterium]
MTKLKQVYKCPICGNIVEIVHTGAGELVCCGKPMQLQKENSIDVSLEKHVPVIFKTENGYRIIVGVELHPMTEEHHIEWIEIIADGNIYRKELKPGDAPEAEYCFPAKSIEARAYCNLHGLWTAKM